MRRTVGSSFCWITLLVLALFSRASLAGEFPRDWTFDDDDDQTFAAHQAIVGKPMPALDVSNWINGEIKPADMKGKVIVIDFFATWCGPCIAHFPQYNELFAKYKDKGVVVMAVCTTEEGQDELEKLAKDKDIKFPTAKDPKLAAKQAWAVSYYPTYAVIDRTGKVRALGVQPSYVEKVVEAVLKDDAKK